MRVLAKLLYEPEEFTEEILENLVGILGKILEVFWLEKFPKKIEDLLGKSVEKLLHKHQKKLEKKNLEKVLQQSMKKALEKSLEELKDSLE